jgi:hypothetical protein
MENDLNTPSAVDVMIDLAGHIIQVAEQGGDVAVAQEKLRKMANLFGMRIGEGAEERVLKGWGEHAGRFGS